MHWWNIERSHEEKEGAMRKLGGRGKVIVEEERLVYGTLRRSAENLAVNGEPGKGKGLAVIGKGPGSLDLKGRKGQLCDGRGCNPGEKQRIGWGRV